MASENQKWKYLLDSFSNLKSLGLYAAISIEGRTSVIESKCRKSFDFWILFLEGTRQSRQW